jgi:CspA family cold shock protein
LFLSTSAVAVQLPLNRRARCSRAKGYGFITPSEGGEDLFAHHTAIQMTGFKTLKEGQKVEFEVKRGPKGLQAANIKPI